MDEKKPQRELRGLYRYVHISVRSLDKIIIAVALIILLLVAVDLAGGSGFTVHFDSKGGTDVPHQTQMYGEALVLPQPPAREGYTFTGWYLDEACLDKWDPGTDTVQGDMTLYAGWEPEQ